MHCQYSVGHPCGFLKKTFLSFLLLLSFLSRIILRTELEMYTKKMWYHSSAFRGFQDWGEHGNYSNYKNWPFWERTPWVPQILPWPATTYIVIGACCSHLEVERERNLPIPALKLSHLKNGKARNPTWSHDWDSIKLICIGNTIYANILFHQRVV